VPVAHNAGLFWSRQALRKHAGTIDLVIGPPLYPEGRSASELTALAEAWVENTCRSLPPFTT
jgi:1-acyl-sn-glycerol-3-phosphate acyltransferase